MITTEIFRKLSKKTTIWVFHIKEHEITRILISKRERNLRFNNVMLTAKEIFRKLAWKTTIWFFHIKEHEITRILLSKRKRNLRFNNVMLTSKEIFRKLARKTTIWFFPINESTRLLVVWHPRRECNLRVNIDYWLPRKFSENWPKKRQFDFFTLKSTR